MTRQVRELVADGRPELVRVEEPERAARENQRVAGDRYHEGLVASSDLLDAEVALQRAGVDRAEALAQLRLAAANLERAIGR